MEKKIKIFDQNARSELTDNNIITEGNVDQYLIRNHKLKHLDDYVVGININNNMKYTIDSRHIKNSSLLLIKTTV